MQDLHHQPNRGAHNANINNLVLAGYLLDLAFFFPVFAAFIATEQHARTHGLVAVIAMAHWC